MQGTVTRAPADPDWDVLASFWPVNWPDLAAESGALRGWRKDQSPDPLLRPLLIHLGGGHSLRETGVRVRQADWSAAFFKRLRKSCNWLYALCMALFQEQGMAVSARAGPHVRVFEATVVRESGRTGSLWRLHYSMTRPSWGCDFFKLTGTEGPGRANRSSSFRSVRGTTSWRTGAMRRPRAGRRWRPPAAR